MIGIDLKLSAEIQPTNQCNDITDTGHKCTSGNFFTVVSRNADKLIIAYVVSYVILVSRAGHIAMVPNKITSGTNTRCQDGNDHFIHSAHRTQ